MASEKIKGSLKTGSAISAVCWGAVNGCGNINTLALKKLRLLKAAERCFAEKGYYHTTIREVAAIAGTNSCMINYYFGSKQNLLLGIIGLRAKTFEELIAKSKARTRSPLETLLVLSELMIKKVFNEPAFHKLLIQLYTIGEHGEGLAYLYRIKHKNQLYIADILRLGIESGTFSEHADPESVAGVITSVANHYLLNMRYFKWSAGKRCSERTFTAEMLPKAVAEAHLLIKALTYIKGK